MGHLIPSPSDRIQVNAGGRIFETTTTTLMSSGSKFFHALLGPTGIGLAGGEASIQAFDQSPLFLDRDPDLFADILFFMRSNRLPASARRNVDRLEDLQAEADFFVYDALQQACQESLQQYTHSQPTAKSCWIKVDETPRKIPIPPGQMIYIVSAKPTWKQEQEDRIMPPADDDHEYFYQQIMTLRALIKDHSFLLLQAKKSSLGQGDDPMESRLPVSLSCPDEQEFIELVANGSGVLDVMYWIGHASAIPITSRPV
jgi:hypothetical protein